MITKLEKRVLAVLLAAVMCVPVTGFSSVTVNAEETNAEAQINEDEMNGTVTGTEPEEETEGQNPVQKEEDGQNPETADDMEGTDVSDDGAFIPLEDENKKAETDSKTQDIQAETKEETKEDTEEAESVQKSANADADLPEIVLGENGDPVRMKTEQEETKYIFSPKMTDAYYVNVIGYVGSWSVSQKTGDTETAMQGTDAIYEMKAGETYYIRIYGADVEWDFGQVQNIGLGTHETEITAPGQDRYFRLEYGRSDIYWFQRYESWDASIGVNNGAAWDSVYSSAQYKKLNLQEPCYIRVSWGDGSATGSISWAVNETAAEAVKEGQEITTYIDDGASEVIYTFVPSTSGKYTFSEGNFNVYDSDWKLVGLEMSLKAKVILTAGTTYYIVPGYSGGNYKVQWNLSKTNTVAIQTGKEYTSVYGQDADYTFTPAESGRYHFKSEQPADLTINGEYVDYGFDYWVSMEAGTTYEIDINPDDTLQEAAWSVNKGTVKDVTTGTKITSSAGEHVEYRFVPAASGEFLLKSADLGRSQVYNSDGTAVDAFSYQEETGFGSRVSLEKGQTYYIHIAPTEESAVWTIEALGTEGDYNYRVKEDGTAEILKYTGSSSDASVPATIAGKKVTSVGYGAFAQNSTLESVEVPASVTDLQYGAFTSCTNLKSVEFAQGSSLKSIGHRAFASCYSLTDLAIPDGVQTIGDEGFSYSGLTSVEIPDSVTQIGNAVFWNCSSLAEAVIGKGLKSIPENTFLQCESLQKAEIPEGITSIGHSAFSGTKLTSVKIPDSVTTMGEGVFSSCDALTGVTLGSGLKGIESNTFSRCGALTKISIPKNITYIGSGAFDDAGLTSIHIPDSVTSVGERAFADCSNLHEAEIGNSVAYVAQNAFYGCDLTEVTIGNKVEKIEIYGFANNKNLKSVSIPNSVTEIQYNAFSGCESLLDIEIPDSVEAIGRQAFDGTAWYEAQKDGLVYAGKVLYQYKGQIPEGSGEITIAEGTKGIAARAFFGQTALTSVTIPEGVTNIGENAFTGCTSLTEIRIPETVTRIDENAVGCVSASGKPIENFTIYGVEGSAAQTYANTNGFKFVAVEPSYIKGDVNDDEEVTIADLRIVLRKVCGKIELDSIQTLSADVEKDGKVDIQDLRKILRFVCKKIDEL